LIEVICVSDQERQGRGVIDQAASAQVSEWPEGQPQQIYHSERLPYETWARPVSLALVWVMGVSLTAGLLTNRSIYLLVGLILLGIALSILAFWAVAIGDRAEDSNLVPVTRGPDQRAAVALVVIHGIGQQERYETLSALATGMDSVPANDPARFPVTCGFDPAEGRPARVTVRPQFGAAASDTTGVQALTWREDRPTEPPVPIDIYEVYWSPLAQRTRSMRDVFHWLREVLVMTALRFGARRPPNGPFASTGAPVPATLTEIRHKALREVRFVLAGALALFGLCISVGFGFALAFERATGQPPDRLLSDPLAQLRLAFAAVPMMAWALTAILLYALGMLGGGWWRLAGLRREMRRIGPVAQLHGTESVYYSASFTRLEKLRGAVNQHFFRSQLAQAVGIMAIGGLVWGPPEWAAALGLAAVLLAGQQIWYALKGFVTGYLGDIPTYVMASENAETYEARSRIQEKGRAVLLSVLEARQSNREGATPQYEQVLVLGHSLGSVVGRDVLLSLYQMAEGAHDREAQLNRLGRIKAWVTFGSPLRKTQSFFEIKSQPTPTLESLRRAADAALFRLLPWYNFWEMNDLVANPLRDRYPVKYERCIQLRATERTPLFTHNDYWQSTEFLGSVLCLARGLHPYPGSDLNRLNI